MEKKLNEKKEHENGLLESKIQTPKIVRRMHFNNVNK